MTCSAPKATAAQPCRALKPEIPRPSDADLRWPLAEQRKGVACRPRLRNRGWAHPGELLGERVAVLPPFASGQPVSFEPTDRDLAKERVNIRAKASPAK